jgi:hypothetical protein
MNETNYLIILSPDCNICILHMPACLIQWLLRQTLCDILQLYSQFLELLITSRKGDVSAEEGPKEKIKRM